MGEYLISLLLYFKLFLEDQELVLPFSVYIP